MSFHKKFSRKTSSAGLIATAFALTVFTASTAYAHVALTESIADVGTNFNATFRIGHGCDGSPTKAITVTLPDQVKDATPVAKAGWTASTKVTPAGNQVVWNGNLPNDKKDELVLQMKLPAKPTNLWFKVLQECEKGSTNWAEIPATGTSTKELKSPAALLQVMAPQFANMPIRIDGAWVRSTVPGQTSTGAFMKITSREKLTLIGGSTPAAKFAEVHEMKMNGDVMQMREVSGLDVAPAKPLELTPSTQHMMLMDLAKPLSNGSTVPLRLVFKNEKGVESKVDIEVPVGLSFAGAAGQKDAAPEAMHMHKH